ncbi:TetR family transcriptional regulator [Nocardia tenerifensis]|uniref:TetR family transcriptional regulator n=1 Tax=Nocardia tenerifensis TaxID=228006 RepID=A0A318JS54_9NOCA|nr:TetR/AcrR family transcriptional regulator [Nocardia tenerifensis]PXX58812.1 TetR family transcriptional regulator [Nocardia tenerifensis]
MTATDPARSPAGRPRDGQIDRAVLDAVRALLAEVGYQEVTIAAVARRAGVGTAPIYRRWPGKEALIEDAVFGSENLWLPEVTEDLHADLIAWARLFLERIAEPATRAAVPGLMSAYHHAPEYFRALHDRADLPARKALAERIAPELPGGRDESATSDLVFEILVARTLVRGVTHGLDDAETFCRRTADALLAIVRAADLT